MTRIVCALLAALLVAAGIAGCTRPTSHAPPPPTPVSIDQLASHVDAGGARSLTAAEELFSEAVQPLPGVTLPAGTPAPTADGTQAIAALWQYRDRLTPQQRAAAAGALQLPGPGVVQRKSGGGSIVPSWVAPQVDDIRQWYATQLGRQLPGLITVRYVDLRGDLADSMPAGVDWLQPWRPLGHWQGCVIRLSGPWFGHADRKQDQLTSLAHEVFHCFQLAYDDKPFGYFVPDWVGEGQATWAAEEYVHAHGLSDQFWDSDWQTYAQGKDPLFGQSYSAVGFYASLSASREDVWHTLDPMLAALESVGPCDP